MPASNIVLVEIDSQIEVIVPSPMTCGEIPRALIQYKDTVLPV